MTNTAQIHDGANWRTPASYEVFDGSAWKGVSKKEVYDGTKWVEIFADNPTQPLKKPGTPGNLRLRQLNRADGTFAIRASWELPSSGDTEWYEYQWVSPASGSWTANGNTRIATTGVEIPLKQPIKWDGAFAFRVAAYNKDYPGGGAWASTSGAHFPLTKPEDPKPAGQLPPPENIRLKTGVADSWKQSQWEWDAVAGAVSYKITFKRLAGHQEPAQGDATSQTNSVILPIKENPDWGNHYVITVCGVDSNGQDGNIGSFDMKGSGI
ncbi:hypothetical protein ACWCWQ_01875 [Streptomyces sp. NPDC001571]